MTTAVFVMYNLRQLLLRFTCAYLLTNWTMMWVRLSKSNVYLSVTGTKVPGDHIYRRKQNSPASSSSFSLFALYLWFLVSLCGQVDRHHPCMRKAKQKRNLNKSKFVEQKIKEFPQKLSSARNCTRNIQCMRDYCSVFYEFKACIYVNYKNYHSFAAFNIYCYLIHLK